MKAKILDGDKDRQGTIDGAETLTDAKVLSKFLEDKITEMLSDVPILKYVGNVGIEITRYGSYYGYDINVEYYYEETLEQLEVRRNKELASKNRRIASMANEAKGLGYKLVEL